MPSEHAISKVLEGMCGRERLPFTVRRSSPWLRPAGAAPGCRNVPARERRRTTYPFRVNRSPGIRPASYMIPGMPGLHAASVNPASATLACHVIGIDAVFATNARPRSRTARRCAHETPPAVSDACNRDVRDGVNDITVPAVRMPGLAESELGNFLTFSGAAETHSGITRVPWRNAA